MKINGYFRLVQTCWYISSRGVLLTSGGELIIRIFTDLAHFSVWSFSRAVLALSLFQKNLRPWLNRTFDQWQQLIAQRLDLSLNISLCVHPTLLLICHWIESPFWGFNFVYSVWLIVFICKGKNRCKLENFSKRNHFKEAKKVCNLMRTILRALVRMVAQWCVAHIPTDSSSTCVADCEHKNCIRHDFNKLSNWHRDKIVNSFSAFVFIDGSDRLLTFNARLIRPTMWMAGHTHCVWSKQCDLVRASVLFWTWEFVLVHLSSAESWCSLQNDVACMQTNPFKFHRQYFNMK